MRALSELTLSMGACRPNLKFVSSVILELLACNAQKYKGSPDPGHTPFSKKNFRGHKNCDLDLSVEWFQLLFRKIKLTSMKAIVCPEGAKFLFVRLIHSTINLYSLNHSKQCQSRHNRGTTTLQASWPAGLVGNALPRYA